MALQLTQFKLKESSGFHRAALAHAGDCRAMVDLVACYRTGNGVAADAAKAAWLRRAAQAGDLLAQNDLGICLLQGAAGIAGDAAEAVTWLLRAAEAGYRQEQFDLACCTTMEPVFQLTLWKPWPGRAAQQKQVTCMRSVTLAASAVTAMELRLMQHKLWPAFAERLSQAMLRRSTPWVNASSKALASLLTQCK